MRMTQRRCWRLALKRPLRTWRPFVRPYVAHGVGPDAPSLDNRERRQVQELTDYLEVAYADEH